MSDKLSEDKVKYIARLARIKISDEEATVFKNQMSSILDFVSSLNSIDTSNIETLSRTTELVNVFREDEIKPSLTKEEALLNAPNRYQNYFKTKPVLGEK